MEPSYKLFANIHVFISSDIKRQKNAFRCRRSRELISNSWKKLCGTTRALGEWETPLHSRGSHTCGASWENVHKVAVRHKNAIELLFGFGVTRKVHSPVWRKRERYGHWHGTTHVPPQPLKNWGNYGKGGSHVTKSLTLSVRPKAAAGPAESSCLSLRTCSVTVEAATVTKEEETWVIYKIHVYSSSCWVSIL